MITNLFVNLPICFPYWCRTLSFASPTSACPVYYNQFNWLNAKRSFNEAVIFSELRLIITKLKVLNIVLTNQKVLFKVDVIILKDVVTPDQLRKFRKGNKKFSTKPILLWPPSLEIDDLNELIRVIRY